MSLLMWGDDLDEQYNTQALDPSSPEGQFETLTAQKVALWEQIKDNADYEQTPEWAQIRELDVQLLALDAQIKGGQ